MEAEGVGHCSSQTIGFNIFGDTKKMDPLSTTVGFSDDWRYVQCFQYIAKDQQYVKLSKNDCVIAKCVWKLGGTTEEFHFTIIPPPTSGAIKSTVGCCCNYFREIDALYQPTLFTKKTTQPVSIRCYNCAVYKLVRVLHTLSDDVVSCPANNKIDNGSSLVVSPQNQRSSVDVVTPSSRTVEKIGEMQITTTLEKKDLVYALDKDEETSKPEPTSPSPTTLDFVGHYHSSCSNDPQTPQQTPLIVEKSTTTELRDYMFTVTDTNATLLLLESPKTLAANALSEKKKLMAWIVSRVAKCVHKVMSTQSRESSFYPSLLLEGASYFTHVLDKGLPHEIAPSYFERPSMYRHMDTDQFSIERFTRWLSNLNERLQASSFTITSGVPGTSTSVATTPDSNESTDGFRNTDMVYLDHYGPLDRIYLNCFNAACYIVEKQLNTIGYKTTMSLLEIDNSNAVKNDKIWTDSDKHCFIVKAIGIIGLLDKDTAQ